MRYTEGIMHDGACILDNGEKITISEVLKCLNNNGDYAALSGDFVFMALEWLNNKPIIDGSKVFKDKIKCIEYIQNLPKIDGLEWTIAKLEIVA